MDEHLTNSEGLLPVEESAEQFSHGYAAPNGEAVTDDEIPDPDAPTPWNELPDKIKNRITWATRYLEAGFPVILLSPGRKDPPKRKQVIPFNDVAALQRALARPVGEHYPNYGVRGGPGHVWVDLDNGTKNGVKRQGERNFRVLAGEHGGLPSAFAAKTPSKGGHLLFKVPEPVGNANSLPEHVDTRGINGYVVGVGCEIIKGLCDPDDTPGCYEHVSGSLDNIPDAPAWLFDKLTTARAEVANLEPLLPWDLPESVEAARDFLLQREPAVQGEGGDFWTYQTFAWLCDFGVNLEKAIELVLEPREETNGESWNSRCAPPWEVEGSKSLRTKALSAYSPSHQNRPGVKSPVAKAQRLAKASGTLGGTGHGASGADDSELPDDDEKLDVSAHLFNVRDFLGRGKRRKFVIPGWLPAKGFTGLLAKRGTGKSAIMTDLAARMACGVDWQEVPIDPAYTVSVYLCGEDDDGLELNLAAWEQEHGRKIPTDRLIISDKIMQLKSRAEVEAWADAIAEKVGDRLAVVFLDTWQRATATTKGQSADDEMAQCVENAEYLLSRLNAPGIIAFHPPKAIKSEDELTVMGSSVIENTSVAIWTLWERADGLRLRSPRIKGAAKGGYRMFKLRVIELDEKDQFGRPQTAVIPEKFAGVEDTPEKRKAREEAQREAWAWMVRHLMRMMHEKDGEVFTPNRDQISKRAADAMERTDSLLYSVWHRDAEQAGLVSFSERTIKRELTEHFFPEKGAARAVDFEDGLRLTVVGKGRKRMFKLMESPLARKMPVAAE